MNTEENNSIKFEKVYAKYKKKVFNAAMSYCENNYHLAQEVTQEVFARCFVYKIYLEEEAKIVTWLKLVTRNHCIDLTRVHKGEIIIDLVTQRENEEISQVLKEKQLREDEIFIAKKKAQYIFDTLYNKNRIWYDCMLMHYLFQMKDNDIAERMNMTVGAVKMNMIRAKSWVKEHCSINKDT